MCQQRRGRFIMISCSRVGFFKKPSKIFKACRLWVYGSCNIWFGNLHSCKGCQEIRVWRRDCQCKTATIYYYKKKRDRDVGKGFVHILVQAWSSKQVLTSTSHRLSISCHRLTLLCHQLPYFLLVRPRLTGLARQEVDEQHLRLSWSSRAICRVTQRHAITFSTLA